MALNHKDRSSGQKSAAITRAMMVLLCGGGEGVMKR